MHLRILTLVVCLLYSNTLAVKAGGAKCVEPVIAEGVAVNAVGFIKSTYKVASLNMARETRIDAILADIRKITSLTDADIWLLQEVAQPASAKPVAMELARSLNLNYVFAPTDILDNGKLLSGLAILSRYPIKEPRSIRLLRYNIKINTRCRIALEAKIDGPSGPIHIYNVHLDTRISQKQRMDQMDPVLQAASSSQGPTLVGGDFNTANIRWLWNILPVPYAESHSNHLRSVFQGYGFDSPLDKLPASISFLWFSLRLDWIFPKGLQAISAGVEDIGFSDHRAVWVELSTNQTIATKDTVPDGY